MTEDTPSLARSRVTRTSRPLGISVALVALLTLLALAHRTQRAGALATSAPAAQAQDAEPFFHLKYPRRRADRVLRPPSTTASPEIVVHVLDAKTREPLRNASLHSSPDFDSGLGCSETLEHGAVFVRSTPGDVRAARVGFARPVTKGRSPLRISRSEDRIAWVTAAGYGWAHFFPDQLTRNRLVVLLEPAVDVDLVPQGNFPDAQTWVTVKLFDEAGDPREEQLAGGTVDGRIRFRGVPPGSATVIVNDGRPERTVSYHGIARIDLRPGPLSIQPVPLKASAAELRLRLLVDESGGFTPGVKSIRYGQSAGTGSTSFSVEVRKTGSVGNFAVYEPVRAPALQPGLVDVTVLPQGLTFQREVLAAAPLEWELEVPPAPRCNVQVWDVVHDRPYTGPLWIIHGAASAGEPRRRLGDHQRLSLGASGMVDCELPLSEFAFWTEPEALIVSRDKLAWQEDEDRPRSVVIDVRPLSRLSFRTRDMWGRARDRYRLEDQDGNRVEPVSVGPPFYYFGTGPDDVFISVDAEGPHWLIRNDRPAADPTQRVLLELQRGLEVRAPIGG